MAWCQGPPPHPLGGVELNKIQQGKDALSASVHWAESAWLKVRNDSKSPDGRGLPIRGPQRLSPYADGGMGLAVLKSQVSLF